MHTRLIPLVALMFACNGGDPTPPGDTGSTTPPRDTDAEVTPPGDTNPPADTDVTPPADTDPSTDTDPPDTDLFADTDLPPDTDTVVNPPVDTGLDTDWFPLPPPIPLDPTTCNPDWDQWDAAVPAGAGAAFIGYPDSHAAWRSHPTLSETGVFNLTSGRHATLDDDGVLSAGQVLTVNLWVRVPDSGGADGVILRVRPDAITHSGFEIRRSGNRFAFAFAQQGSTNLSTLTTPAGSVEPGVWQMITVSTLIEPAFPSGLFYRRNVSIDGVQLTSSSDFNPLQLDPDTPVTLGTPEGNHANVQVGQLTAWTTAASLPQVRSLFNLDADSFNRRNVPGPMSPMGAPDFALYPRDCDGPPLQDTSTPDDTDPPDDTDTDTGPGDTDTDTGPGDTDTGPGDTDTDTCERDAEWVPARPTSASTTFQGFPTDTSQVWAPRPDGGLALRLEPSRHVDIAGAPALDSATQTLEMWVRPSSNGHLYSNRRDALQFSGLNLYILNNNAFAVVYTDTGSGWRTLNGAAGSYVSGQWHHVAVVIGQPAGTSGNNMRLYVNGQQTGPTVAVGSPFIAGDAIPRLGLNMDSSATADIGEMRIYGIAGTGDNILHRYNARAADYGLTPDSSPGAPILPEAAFELAPPSCADDDTDTDPAVDPNFGQTCAPDGAVWAPVLPAASSVSMVGFPSDANDIWAPHPIEGRAALQLEPDRYVDLPVLSTFYRQSYAIEMWVNLSGDGHLFSLRNDPSQFSGSNITVSGNTLSAYIASSASNWRTMSGPGTFTMGTWQHVVLTATPSGAQGASFALYVNGTQVGFVVATTLHYGSGAVPRIGLTSNASARGQIGAFRTYATSMSADEVRARYNAQAADYGRALAAPGTPVTELPALMLDPRLCDGEPTPPLEGETLFDVATCVADPDVWPTRGPNLSRAVRTSSLPDAMWEGLPFGDRGVIAMQPGEALDVELPARVPGAANVTYGAWVRLPADFSATDEGVIFETRDAAGDVNIEVGVSAANGFYATLRENDTSILFRTANAGAAFLNPGTWQHVALRITGTSDTRLFVDGANRSSLNVLNPLHTGDVQVLLGSPTGDAFIGELGAFHAWPSAIPNGDLVALAGTPFGLPSNLPTAAIDLAPADCGDVLGTCDLTAPDATLPEAGSAANDAVPFSTADVITWEPAPGLGQVARLVPMALPELSPGSLVDGPASISLWVRADVDATDGTLITTRDATLGDAGIELRVNSAGNYELVTDDPGTFSFVTTATTVPARRGEWQHVVLSFERQTSLGDFYPIGLYIDGVQAINNSFPALIRPEAVFTLGASPAQASPTLDAHIGAVRVYNSRLFVNQAQALFENERGPYGGAAPNVAPPSNTPLFSYLPQGCEGF